jgi:hypothetical protein
MGKLLAVFTGVSAWLKGTPRVRFAVPLWTETPVANSATYHSTVTAPLVPTRRNSTWFPAAASRPLTFPFSGMLADSDTLKTRKAWDAVTGGESATVVTLLPFPIVVDPDCRDRSCAASREVRHPSARNPTKANRIAPERRAGVERTPGVDIRPENSKGRATRKLARTVQNAMAYGRMPTPG